MSTQPQLGDFCWYELMTTDIKKAKEFYSSLFGWSYQEHDMGHMTYTTASCGNKGIGGIMEVPAERKGQMSPHWTGYIHVANVDESVEKAKSLGATVCVPPTQVSDYGRFAVIQDPTGAAIAMWQSLKDCADECK